MMSEWQLCPVCGGRGTDQFITASTAIPTRQSDPCHRCNGTGTILPPGVVECVVCGKVKKIGALHLCA